MSQIATHRFALINAAILGVTASVAWATPGALSSETVTPPQGAISIFPGGDVKSIVENAASGSWIVLETGNHWISSEVNIPSGITLSGRGSGSVLNWLAPQNEVHDDQIFEMLSNQPGMSNVTLRDFVIDAHRDSLMNTAHANRVSGVAFVHNQAHPIQDVINVTQMTIRNANGMGLHVNGAQGVHIWENDVHDNGGIGDGTNTHLYHNIYVRNLSGTTTNVIEQNYARNSFSGYGVKVTFSQNVLVDHVDASGNFSGMQSAAITDALTVRNSIFQNNKDNGIILSNETGETVHGFLLENNTIRSNINSGIRVVSGSDGTIRGNRLLDLDQLPAPSPVRTPADLLLEDSDITVQNNSFRTISSPSGISPSFVSQRTLADGFADGQRIGGGDPRGGAWYAEIPSKVVMVSSNTPINKGPAMKIIGASDPVIVATPGTINLTAGNTLEVSFKMYLSAKVNDGAGIRFGVYNSNGSSYNGDGDGQFFNEGADSDDSGYWAMFGTGGFARAEIKLENGSDDDVLGGNGAILLKRDDTIISPSTFNTLNAARDIKYRISRDAADATHYAFSLLVDGLEVANVGRYVGQANFTEYNVFNEFAIKSGIDGVNFTIDDVSVGIIPNDWTVLPTIAPEPGALLGVLAAFPLMSRRRRVA